MDTSFRALPALTEAKRRRLVVGALARAIAAVGVILALYYQLPFNRSWDAHLLLRLVAGIFVFGALMVWQLRKIASVRYPGLRAAEALGLLLSLFLVIFASTYFLMEQSSPGSFNEPLTRTDALYFTITTFATVGYGDIVPKSETARIILMVQMIGDLAIIGAGARVLLQAVNRGRERQSATKPNLN